MKQSSLRMESSRLHSQATGLLRKHQLPKRLERYGEVMFTGSYAANLMTTGDVDIYVVGTWTKESVRNIFDSMLDQLDVKAWQLFNWVQYRDPRFPKAWFIGLRDVYRGRKWKIDIWFLTTKQVDQIPFSKWETISVSSAQRTSILRFKKYRDQMRLEIPSYRIYEAVLENGAMTTKEIEAYCAKRRG